MMKDTLKKMDTNLQDVVQYRLDIHGENILMNELIGKQIKIEWSGKGINKVGIDKSTDKILVAVDPNYFRPTEVELLLGDASKAKEILGWKTTVQFEDLVQIMVKADWERVKRRGY